MTTELNAQDVKILELLQSPSNMTTQEIADHINMSQSPCWRRIRRLYDEGYVTKQVAVLNREKLAMDIVVFASVNLSVQGRNNLQKFEQDIQEFPEVVECYTMAGMWDYMLKIVTKDIRHFEIFVRQKLVTMEHIGEIHSHIAVTEIKNSTELPLSTQL